MSQSDQTRSDTEENTHRPAKNHSPGVKVDLHDLALRHHLHPCHLAFGQHLIHKVVPGDVPPTGGEQVQQAHASGNDEENAQALLVHLILLLAPLLFL